MDLNNRDKSWTQLKFHDDDKQQIIKPDEIILNDNNYPPKINNKEILDRIKGSIIGMAIGDALGAHVEFRPREYLKSNPVEEFQGGGTWGLEKGQFTDDTSMALCLANSLIWNEEFIPYDQLMRYKWWYRYGYMSSTGHCFDIGSATKQSIQQFEIRQRKFAEEYNLSLDQMDYSSNPDLYDQFHFYCSQDGVAGNGALMRLAPVPLFFYLDPIKAIEYSGISGQITHGDIKAYDACRYYAALIIATLHGENKENLLKNNFYEQHISWFNNKHIHQDILNIAQGSYKKQKGYDDGIRGKGYIVNALQAALWAFWSDENSFEKGVRLAVNLGDDTDTTAAIYGQLAGAYYTFNQLPQRWINQIYAKDFLLCISHWIEYQGYLWFNKQNILINSNSNSNSNSNKSIIDNFICRKAIEYNGRIGSFYNINNDSIIDLSSLHFYLNDNIQIKENKCFIINGNEIINENILKYLHFDDQLRLNLILNIKSPNGISLSINYPYLIDENTRILYYYYKTKHQGYIKNLNEIKKSIEEFYLLNKEITHIITGMDIGIECIILFKLKLNYLNLFDKNINEIKDSLINNNLLNINDNILFNNQLSFIIYSNNDQLNKQNTFYDIYKLIYFLKNDFNNYQPINYILESIQSYLLNDQIHLNLIQTNFINKIENYLLKFLWINKYWLTIIEDNLLLNLFKIYLNEQLNDIDQKLIQLNQIYLNEQKRFQNLILNISQDNLNENYFLKDNNNNNEILLNDIINLKEKSLFINNIIEKKYIYKKSNDFNINENDNLFTIQDKLSENNTFYICSNDYLNNIYINQFNQLSSQLLNKLKLNSNIKLIYIDFTYSKYQLNQIEIYPKDKQIQNENHFSYLLSNEIIKSNNNLLSIDENNINILLFGKSGVGKSTLINTFYNYIKLNNQLINLPKILISFSQSILIDHEEHIVYFGNKDFNEDHYHSDQSSTTKQCKLYKFKLNNKQYLSFIDTPGFGKTNNDQSLIEDILSNIINLNYLNAILIIIDSNDFLFDNYQTSLTYLFEYLGNDLAKNIIFCFTKYLSQIENNIQRDLNIKTMIESFNISQIDFNQENIFYFDSSFFINSTILNYFNYQNNLSSLTYNDNRNITINQWKHLINYINNNFKPYFIKLNFQKIKLLIIQIKKLIRPLFETLRNYFRNLILLKNNLTNNFIQLNPISLKYPSALCYLCNQNFNQYLNFIILSDSTHEFRDICYTCTCSQDKHFQINYKIQFTIENNQSNKDIISLNDLFFIITNLSFFLIENLNNNDLFLIYLNRIIDEEKFICEHFGYHHFNFILYNQLIQFKNNYLYFIKNNKENYFNIHYIIQYIQNIPSIQKQLDIINQIQQSSF